MFEQFGNWANIASGVFNFGFNTSVGELGVGALGVVALLYFSKYIIKTTFSYAGKGVGNTFSAVKTGFAGLFKFNCIQASLGATILTIGTGLLGLGIGIVSDSTTPTLSIEELQHIANISTEKSESVGALANRVETRLNTSTFNQLVSDQLLARKAAMENSNPIMSFSSAVAAICVGVSLLGIGLVCSVRGLNDTY